MPKRKPSEALDTEVADASPLPNPDDEAKAPRSGARVQSLDRAFGILEAIATSPRGAGLVELSKHSGLHTSTVFHLVRTLLALDYVRQDPETKRYRVGRKLFALAAGANDEANLVFLADPLLRRLADISGESSHLAVRTGEGVVIIAKCDPQAAIRMAERLGAVRPYHSTAIGKVLLAALPDAQIEAFFRSADLARHTEFTIQDPAELKRQLGEIRVTGLAVDDREYNGEARCVAGTVRDFSGNVVAALGISAPVFRLPPERMAKQRQLVSEYARLLSTELGFNSH